MYCFFFFFIFSPIRGIFVYFYTCTGCPTKLASFVGHPVVMGLLWREARRGRRTVPQCAGGVGGGAGAGALLREGRGGLPRSGGAGGCRGGSGGGGGGGGGGGRGGAGRHLALLAIQLGQGRGRVAQVEGEVDWGGHSLPPPGGAPLPLQCGEGGGGVGEQVVGGCDGDGGECPGVQVKGGERG